MMMRSILASTAFAALLAAGAYAQETPPAEGEQAPAVGTEQAPEEVMPEAETAEDPAATAEDPAMAQEPAAEDPAMAQEPAAEEDPAMAQEPATTEDPALAEEPALAGEENLTQVENEALSAETLMGADIQTPEGESIATVDDVLLTPEGQVESVVATFGGFLGFGTNTVELALEEIEVYTDESGTIIVRTSLTPEELEGRPQYEEEPVEG